MIAPALPRWVAEAMADPESGVNALRHQVPRAPIDNVPPEVAVYNAIDDAWLARRSPLDPVEVTPALWVLQVNVGEELQLDGDPLASGSLDDTAVVVIHLAGVAMQSDNAQALASAHRLMRAVRRCLLTAWQDVGMGGLLLEGQRFTLPATLQLLTQEPKPGSGAVDLALVIPFSSTDTWALGAPET